MIGLAGERMELTARTDLDTPTADATAHLHKAVSRVPSITTLMILGYGAADTGHTALALSTGFQQLGHQATQALRVTGDRFHCLLCGDCTPPEGEVIDDAGVAAAAFTYHGYAVLPGRAASDQLVAPVNGLAAQSMRQATDRAAHRLTTAGHVRMEAEQSIDHAMTAAQRGERLADDQAAWLCLILHDLSCRDRAWLRTDDKLWQFELWLDLTRRCEPALVAPVATLLAWCSWRRGEGAVASAALTRALSVDPGYSLALMLLAALSDCLPPTVVATWPPADLAPSLGPADVGHTQTRQYQR